MRDKQSLGIAKPPIKNAQVAPEDLQPKGWKEAYFLIPRRRKKSETQHAIISCLCQDAKNAGSASKV